MQKLTPFQISRAVRLLKKGIPVAFPTETVYGLGAPVFDNEAIQRIFEMKGRPSDNPLICHIASLDQLPTIAKEIPDEVYQLAARFWPGPLTMVLKKQRAVPKSVTGGYETVAVRMPNHPIALELIKQVGQPLAAPSANQSGKPSSTTVEHVLSDFEEGYVIDGGPSQEGIESTVLWLVEGPPIILRPGVIKREQLMEVLGREVLFGKHDLLKASPIQASPGTRYRHYAPKAKIHIVTTVEEALNYPKAFLMSTVLQPNFHHLTAATFYSLLRRADDEKADAIVVVYNEDQDAALKDRLMRAAGQA